MLNFVDIAPKAVKRHRCEITLPQQAPQRTHRKLSIGSNVSSQSMATLQSEPLAGTHEPSAASEPSAPNNTQDLPVPPHGSKADAIESAQVTALLAELAVLVAQLRPNAAHPTTGSDSQPSKPKRKYTPRKTDQKVEAVPLVDRKWITFKQAAALYPKSEQAFRHLAHKSYQYLKHPKAGLRSNGFEACVVRQPGSRNVYLNAEELERWMAQGQGDAQ